MTKARKDTMVCDTLYLQNKLVLVETLKPATHLAILYADRGDRRKSPGEPGAAMAIFGDRRMKSPKSGMSDVGD